MFHLFLKLIPVVFFFDQVASASSIQICNYKDIQSVCALIKEKKIESIKSLFLNSKDLIDKEKLTDSNLKIDDHQRLESLHKKVKKYLSEFISDGRDEKDLDRQEAELMKRIKYLKVSDLKNESDKKICKDQAYYGFNPQTYSLIICPVALKYPDSALVGIMASFSGRALGVCMSKALDKAKVTDENKKVANLESIDFKDHPFQRQCKTTNGVRACQPEQGLSLCLKNNGFDHEINFDLEKKVKSQKISAEELNQEINESLVRNHNFIKMNHPSLLIQIGDLDSYRLNEKNRALARSVIENNSSCYPGLTHQRIDIGFQDWIGAEVVSQYLKDHPIDIKKDHDSLEPLAALIDYECQYENKKDLNDKFNHESKIRFDGAIFANEKLSKYFKCETLSHSEKPKDTQICSMSYRSFGPNSLVAPSIEPVKSSGADSGAGNGIGK